MQFSFFRGTFNLVYLLALQATERAQRCSARLLPRLLSADSLNVSHVATITEGRTYSLIWCFFHSTYVLSGWAETMQVEPTWPVSAKVSGSSKPAVLSSVVQGCVLAASAGFNSLDLLLLCSGDVAECCSEVTQVRQRAVQKSSCWFHL